MPHNGTIDYGQEIPVVIPDTPVISVTQLEELSYAKAVKADTTVRNVVLSSETNAVVLPVVSEVDITLVNNGIFDIEVVNYAPVLSDFDLIQLDLYAAYGNAYDAREVFYALSRLVSTHLYKGTNGITP